MFKKWYWIGVLGVFEFMIVNGRIAWNISSKEGHDDRLQLPRGKFCVILAEQMIASKDESAGDHVIEERMQQLMILSGHHPTFILELFVQSVVYANRKMVSEQH